LETTDFWLFLLLLLLFPILQVMLYHLEVVEAVGDMVR